MTEIAVLGSGNVARALTGPLRARGHRVTVGSRTPDRVTWTDATDLGAAAAGAEVVVNALPGDVAVATLAALPIRARVLIDVANVVPPYAEGSLAERIQAVLPGTAVVKALNTMHSDLMAATGARPDVFLAGADAGAKAEVAALLRDVGWPGSAVLDLGDLTKARWLEAFTAQVRPLVEALGPVPFGLSITAGRPGKPGRPDQPDQPGRP